MSPAMLDKYVAAAKGIAAHAVLLPDGFRFSDEDHAPRLDRRDRQPRSAALSAAHRPRGQQPGQPPGARLGHQRRGPHPAGALPVGDDPVPRRAARRRGRPSRRSRPRPTSARNTCRRCGTSSTADEPVAAARPPPRPLANGRARRRGRAGRRDPPVAGRADEVQQRRPLQAVDGAGQPAGGVAGDPPEARPPSPTPATSSSTSSRATRATAPMGDLVEWRQPRLEMPGRPPILAARPPRRPPRAGARSVGRSLTPRGISPPSRTPGRSRARRRRGDREGAQARSADARRLVRLSRHGRPGAAEDRRPLRRADRERRRVHVRQGLGLARDAERRRQLLRPRGPHPRHREAATASSSTRPPRRTSRSAGGARSGGP